MQLRCQNTAVKLGLLDVIFASELVPQLMSGHATHAPARDLIARIARFTTDVGYIKAIIGSVLPAGYAGNTLDEIDKMVSGAVSKSYDKPKALPGEKAMAAVDRRNLEVVIDQQREPFLGIPQRDGGVIFEPLRSTSAKAYIRLIAYEAAGKPIKQDALAELIDTMEAKALYGSRQVRLHLRFGRDGGTHVIDPGWETGERIIISAGSWRVGQYDGTKFRRAPGFAPMPHPGKAGGLKQLIKLLGLTGRNAILFVVFLMSCMRPDGPYMFLMIEGEQGSGKSLLSQFIRRIVDPNTTPKSRLPKNEQELMILAGENFLLIFDNASSMRWDMSDALCALATGSGYSTRKYYTDNESRTFNYARPVSINGIGQFAHRPDFLERSIQLRLTKMPAGKRLPEKELEKRFDEILPDVLFDLLEASAVALARMNETEAPTEIRMADAAHWVVAAEPALGLREGEVLAALIDDQTETMVDYALGDPLVLAIVAQVQRSRIEGNEKGFNGTVKELLDELTSNADGRNDRWLPQSPSQLSTQIRRLAPSLAIVGVEIAYVRRSRGQEISITMAPSGMAAAIDDKTVRQVSGMHRRIGKV